MRRLQHLSLVVGMLLFISSGKASAGEVYSAINVIASSEPVPVSDMISGWDGPFKPGEYAYADARFRMGVDVSGWRIEREQRRYYYFTFSRETSRFYNSLERGNQLLAAPVDIEAKSFSALGIRLAKQLDFDGWSVTPAVAVYRVGNFQFGTLTGTSEGGGQLKASAALDYYFNEDKILEFDADADQGRALSLDLNVEVDLVASWHLSVQASDLYNRINFSRAAFTKGCVNFGSPKQPVCNSATVGAGRSGHESYNTDIPFTLATELTNDELQWQASLYWHDRYKRLGIQKNWTTPVGSLGVSGHTTRQAGIHWQSDWHALSLMTDELKAVKIRDADVHLTLRYRW